MKKKYLQPYKLVTLLLTLALAVPTSVFGNEWAQAMYRVYTIDGELTPNDPWSPGAYDVGENTPVTLSDYPPRPEQPMRVRVALQRINGSDQTQTFSLQYVQETSCSSIPEEDWEFVNEIGGDGPWRGYDIAASSTVDGAALPSTTLSVSNVAQSLEEQNPTATMPVSVSAGEYAEWDWIIQNHDAPFDTPYCFRMVYSDGTPLESYNEHILIFTDAPYTPQSQDWRFYTDEENETPTAALAAVNTTVTSTIGGDILKLRMTIKETMAGPGNNIKMRLQYSTDSNFTTVRDVIPISDCTATSTWCYADGGDDDDDAITTQLLGDSTAAGVHNESPSSTSTYDPAANEATEWEFTIRSYGVEHEDTYYFRAYDETNQQVVTTEGSHTYPNVSIGNTGVLSMIGINSGETLGGITTDVTTTPTSIPFSTVSLSTKYQAAQKLVISTTNPSGYQVGILAKSPMQNHFGVEINEFTADNSSPTAWPSHVSSGAFGYHTTDPLLAGNSNRFAADDTYAAFTTSTEEIAFYPEPITDAEEHLIYQIEIGPEQASGIYSGSYVYVLSPLL